MREAKIERLIDVRLNNTSHLAGFARREDLRYLLHEICDAVYVYEPLLAPTKGMLNAYKKAMGMWAEYENRFLALMRERRIEKHVDRESFATRTAFLCSERTPEYCHRRLMIEDLGDAWGEVSIFHL